MNQQTYYGGKNEFRWEFLPIGQGHYFLASSIQEAVSVAASNAQRDVVIVQQWKPARGQKYYIKPQAMRNWTYGNIIRHYMDQGYDQALMTQALHGAIDVMGQSQGGLGRALTTSEERWATIRHRKSGTVATIIGTHYGSFNVYVPKEDHKLALPFEKVHEWEVLKGDPNQPHTARWFQEDYDGEIRKYSQQHSTYKGAYEHMVGLHNSAQYVGKHFQIISITPG